MTGSAGQNSSNATKLLATPDSDGPYIVRERKVTVRKLSGLGSMTGRKLSDPEVPNEHA